MIPVRLFLLGLAVIGSIGYAVYNHYKNQEQQYEYNHGRRRRRSLNEDDNSPTFPPQQDSNNSRKRRNRTAPKSQCSICLMTVEKETRYLNCGHGFHQHCIQMWFNSEKNTCPNCRAIIQ